jgi:hypothetical protein
MKNRDYCYDDFSFVIFSIIYVVCLSLYIQLPLTTTTTTHTISEKNNFFDYNYYTLLVYMLKFPLVDSPFT